MNKPHVRTFFERTRVRFTSTGESETDPLGAVDQDVESIVQRFTRIGDASLAALQQREGEYRDVSEISAMAAEHGSLAVYQKSRLDQAILAEAIRRQQEELANGTEVQEPPAHPEISPPGVSVPAPPEGGAPKSSPPA